MRKKVIKEIKEKGTYYGTKRKEKADFFITLCILLGQIFPKIKTKPFGSEKLMITCRVFPFQFFRFSLWPNSIPAALFQLR